MRARTHAPVNSRRTVYAVRPLSRCARTEIASGRIGDQYMHVVGFAVELDQLDIELGAHGAHGGFGEGEHWIGEQFASKLGHEDEVGVQQRHAVPVAAVGRSCQWAPLRLCCG